MKFNETQKKIALLSSLKHPKQAFLQKEGFSAKDYKELLFSRADEPDFVQSQVWREIFEEAKHFEVGRQLINVRRVADNQARFVIDPAEGAVAPTVAEGAEVPWKVEEFGSLTLTCEKIATRPAITREMIEDGLFDAVGEQLRLAGRRVALREDDIIMTALRANSAESTFTVADSSLTNNVDTAGTFTDDLLSDAIEAVEIDGFNPDWCVLRPELMGEARTEAAFAGTDQWAQGGAEIKGTGKASQLFGLNVLMTRHGLSGTADEIAGLVLDRMRAGVMALRRDTTVEQFDDPIRDSVGMVVSKRLAAGRLNEDAICSIQR